VNGFWGVVAALLVLLLPLALAWWLLVRAERRRDDAQRHPDEAAGAAQPLVDVVDRDVGELAAILVGDAVDQHGSAILLAGHLATRITSRLSYARQSAMEVNA